MSSSTNKAPAIQPRRTIRGHTDWVQGAVHLPGGQHIVTCSVNGSLRLCDIQSGAQVGEDWQDKDDDAAVWSMALSSNGKTIASGNKDRTVRLWNVETNKVIARWTGHANVVGALCWSVDGKQVLSRGSWDGTARVWDVKSGKNVLTIETGHRWVNTVIYSPNAAMIATGGWDEDAVKIWDTKTGELVKTLKHDYQVWSLAWMSDRKKLISGSYGPIRIFDTITWEIAVLRTSVKWKLQPYFHIGWQCMHNMCARSCKASETTFESA